MSLSPKAAETIRPRSRCDLISFICKQTNKQTNGQTQSEPEASLLCQRSLEFKFPSNSHNIHLLHIYHCVFYGAAVIPSAKGVTGSTGEELHLPQQVVITGPSSSSLVSASLQVLPWTHFPHFNLGSVAVCCPQVAQALSEGSRFSDWWSHQSASLPHWLQQPSRVPFQTL